MGCFWPALELAIEKAAKGNAKKHEEALLRLRHLKAEESKPRPLLLPLATTYTEPPSEADLDAVYANIHRVGQLSVHDLVERVCETGVAFEHAFARYWPAISWIVKGRWASGCAQLTSGALRGEHDVENTFVVLTHKWPEVMEW